MVSALIVFSKSTEVLAKNIGNTYYDAEYLKVSGLPTKSLLSKIISKDIIYGIGGGSVIDTAKILAMSKSCIAIPTTASGASETSHAVYWDNRKHSISTALPKVIILPENQIELPEHIQIYTFYDALSHALEVLWSINRSTISTAYAIAAIRCLITFCNTKNLINLLIAGITAGKAIELTGTNALHALSYPMTIKYNIFHGKACAMLVPVFLHICNSKEVLKAFGCSTNKDILTLLKNSIGLIPLSKCFDYSNIINEGCTYSQFYNISQSVYLNKNLDDLIYTIIQTQII